MTTVATTQTAQPIVYGFCTLPQNFESQNSPTAELVR